MFIEILFRVQTKNPEFQSPDIWVIRITRSSGSPGHPDHLVIQITRLSRLPGTLRGMSLIFGVLLNSILNINKNFIAIYTFFMAISVFSFECFFWFINNCFTKLTTTWSFLFWFLFGFFRFPNDFAFSAARTEKVPSWIWQRFLWNWRHYRSLKSKN